MKAFKRGAVATAASAALLLGLAACGGDDGDGGDPAAELRAAAEKTAKEDSFRMKGSEKGGPDGEVTSDGAVSGKPYAFDMKLKGEPDEDSPTGEMHLLGNGDTTWIGGGAPVGGKNWIRIEKGDAEQAGDLGPTQDDIDVLALPIDVLRTAEKIEKVGEEEVGGAGTTHYKGTLVTAELAKYKGEALTAKERDDYLEDVKDRGLKEFTVEVWIREDGLLAKTREAGKGKKGDVEAVVEFSDYGTKVTIDEPPADDVMDFSDLMKDAGDELDA